MWRYVGVFVVVAIALYVCRHYVKDPAATRTPNRNPVRTEGPRDILCELFAMFKGYAERRNEERQAPEAQRLAMKAERQSRQAKIAWVDGRAVLTRPQATVEQTWCKVEAETTEAKSTGHPSQVSSDGGDEGRRRGLDLNVEAEARPGSSGGEQAGSKKGGRFKKGWRALKTAVKLGVPKKEKKAQVTARL